MLPSSVHSTPFLTPWGEPRAFRYIASLILKCPLHSNLYQDPTLSSSSLTRGLRREKECQPLWSTPPLGDCLGLTRRAGMQLGFETSHLACLTLLDCGHWCSPHSSRCSFTELILVFPRNTPCLNSVSSFCELGT